MVQDKFHARATPLFVKRKLVSSARPGKPACGRRGPCQNSPRCPHGNPRRAAPDTAVCGSVLGAWFVPNLPPAGEMERDCLARGILLEAPTAFRLPTASRRSCNFAPYKPHEQKKIKDGIGEYFGPS
jgi:hypothetical protein